MDMAKNTGWEEMWTRGVQEVDWCVVVGGGLGIALGGGWCQSPREPMGSSVWDCCQESDASTGV